jgi:hypothetical protein
MAPGRRLNGLRLCIAQINLLNLLGSSLMSAAQEQPESPFEWLSLVGVLAGGLAVAFGIIISRSGWVALGLLAVERLASAVTWRASRRPLVAQVLALAGVASSIAILAVDREMWWMLLLIWFWYGERVYSFFKSPHRKDEDEEPEIAGLTDREKKIVVVMKRFEDEAGFSLIPNIDADQQQELRETCRVPPEDRVLAVWNFDGGSTLVVSTSGVHFFWEHGEQSELMAVRFAEFPTRTFVNQGRSVYLGNNQSLPADGASCETLCQILNALKKVVW